MDLCDCTADGHCLRYRRSMNGRFRQICQGVNVDLGTAAAFRAQWAREAGSVDIGRGRGLSARVTPNLRHVLLRTDQAPGDAVAMTAAIYSLHRAHPGRYLTSVESLWPGVFAHNPDLVPVTPGASLLHMHYPAINDSNRRAIHFMQGWCEFLGAALGVSVPLLTNRPHLYFDPYDHDFEVGDYWVVCSGGKRDFTNKLWGQHNYQSVVDALHGKVAFVQVGDATHDHPRLGGVRDMVGKTNFRALFGLVRRACGVLCGVSLLMHVAAALEKPAVVIAGGREPVAWNAYPRQHYLHTVGALPCLSLQGEGGGGCWRSRVVSLGDGSPLDEGLCQRPVNGTPTRLSLVTLPECMTLVKPVMVADLILRYNRTYGQVSAL